MASVRNIKIYEDVAKGKRVLSILTRDAQAVRTNLSRKGYKVKLRKNIQDPRVTTIYIV